MNTGTIKKKTLIPPTCGFLILQIQVMQDDSKAKSGVFQTGFPTAEIPPLVTTDFHCQDQG